MKAYFTIGTILFCIALVMAVHPAFLDEVHLCISAASVGVGIPASICFYKYLSYPTKPIGKFRPNRGRK